MAATIACMPFAAQAQTPIVSTTLQTTIQGVPTTRDEDDLFDEVLASETKDPLIYSNKLFFDFNDGVDTFVMKPVAEGYRFVVPSYARARVTNFYNNLDEIPTFTNDVLQLNLYQATADFWRFAINSTVGIGGLFDVAAKTGLKHHRTDMGITFAKWGWTNSTYFVIPLLGPSTIRDAIALPIDFFTISAWTYINPWYLRYALLGVDIVNLRANLLENEELRKQISVDDYAFIRDAYLQHRNYQVELSHQMGIKQNPYIIWKGSSQTAKDTVTPEATPDVNYIGEAVEQ